MKYEWALKFMLDLLKVRPDFIVGGSMGLVLQGAIEEREIGDFDFCINAPDADLKNIGKESIERNLGYSLDVCDYSCAEESDYVCYKISSDRIVKGTAYYNIFIRNNTATIPMEMMGQRIIVQHKDEIMKYKKLWLRDKDIADMKGKSNGN